MEDNNNGSLGLVLEGGGFRCLFTTGVLDVFMEHGIQFDAMVGVSAGVLFGCNYKSHQPGRGLRYNIRFKDEPNYMSWKSLRETGNYVNTEFSYVKLPKELDPFDYEAFRQNPMKFYAVCTDIESGESVYHLLEDADNGGMDWLRASSSMPIFARPVQIDGHYYLDGGITDSIPLRFFQNKGYKRNVVVLTQPRRYRKKKAHLSLVLRLWLKQFPKVAQLMSIRHEAYNAQIAYVEQQGEGPDTFLIYPDEKLEIGRVELHEEKMRTIYQAGRQKGLDVLPQLKAFMEERK